MKHNFWDHFPTKEKSFVFLSGKNLQVNMYLQQCVGSSQ